MYSTCLFCGSHLGRNETLYEFPVGRRLAFDSRKGRLWVVCRACERWNLTPAEERWEALEQAERHFRVCTRRVSTDNISLARLDDGTELVRIGEPLRQEYAAWRYGDQFGRRRRRQALIAAGGLGAFGALLAGGAVAGLSVALFGGVAGNAMNAIVNGRAEGTVARVRTTATGTVMVRRRHLAETRLVPGSDGPLALDLRYRGGGARIEGQEAQRIAASLMPHVNRYGGKPDTVRLAVSVLDSVGGSEAYMGHLSKYSADATAVRLKGEGGRRRAEQGWAGAYTSGLYGLSAPDRLALEMALHEESEMRALRGDLSELKRAWKEAEEIASIADDLLTPSSVLSAFERIRRAFR